MAISRKVALKRLMKLAVRVRQHLQTIAANPDALAMGHWRHEVRGWIQQMEEVVLHAGKKTGAGWTERLEAFKATLGSES